MKARKTLITVMLVAALTFVLMFAVSCNATDEPDSGNNQGHASAPAQYTITFNVDGTETTTTVTGGTAVTKPADPEKGGYAFYGWYTDANFKNKFEFDTVITGNMTLYARMVSTDVAANEFEVTFVGADGKTVATAGTQDGVVTALPSEMGEGFVGWWVSDYDSQDKLTYKYDGRKLEQNTTFYAVYSSAATTVSVKTSGIEWAGTGANKNYVVTVTDTYGNTLTRNTTALTYDYGFAAREAGDYVVTVTVDGNTTTAYFKNKGLAKVSHFEVNDSMLVFNKVANADKYVLSVDCGNDEHTHDAVELTTNMYDFINCDMQEGGIKFTITAMGEGFASSEAEFVFERNLEDLRAFMDERNDTLIWNDVENAAYYTIVMTNGGKTYEEYLGNATSYSLKGYTGNMTMTVYAEAKGYNPATSTVTYNKTKLASPEGLKVSSRSFSWNAVTGATGYTVKVGDNEYTAATTYFDTRELDLSSAYTVSVKANASNPANDSYYSDATEVKSALNASDVSYANGMLTWSPVVDTNGYTLQVNDGEEIKITDGSFAYALSFDKAGANTVKLSNLNSRGKVVSTVEMTVVTYALSFMTDKSTTLATKYYAYSDTIEFPTTTKQGYTLGNWYTDAGGYAANGAKFSGKTFDSYSNMALYATWKPNTYKLTMIAGNEGYLEQTTAYVTYGENFTLPIPASTDNLKGFVGWYYADGSLGAKYAGGNGKSLAPWSVASDTTVYAGWQDMFEFELNEGGNDYMVSKSSYTGNAKEITIPAMYNEKPVTVVKEDGFLMCTNLETLNIPDSIQIIETGTAFRYDDNLININIYKSEYNVKGDYYSYDGALFRYNVYEEQPMMQLEYFPLGRKGTYHIPAAIEYTDGDGYTKTAKVEQIPSRAFLNCNIEEVYVPYTVKYINKNAFYNAKALGRIIFEETPNGLDEVALTLDQGAFYQCGALRAITLTTRMADFNSAMISYCNSLEYIDIVGTSDKYASVEGMITNATKDTLLYVPQGRQGTVEIPYGITSIAANAFSPSYTTDSYTGHNPCQNVTKVVIPSWVTNIGAEAFYNCNSLKEVVFQGTKDDSNLTIGNYAFYNTRLETVTIPENAKSVGAYAFGGIMGLTHVTINTDGNFTFSNVFVSEGSARECDVTNVTLGQYVKNVNLSNTFNAEKLASVTVHEDNANHVVEDGGVLYNAAKTTIEFYPLSRTGAYVMPDTVTQVANNFFKNNTVLTAVTIGAGVTKIGTSAFENCYALESVTFAEGCAITNIGNYAFRNCYALASFELPASVTTFGTSSSMLVFEGCSNLNTITIAEGNTKFLMEDGVLYNNDKTKLCMVFPAATGDENGVFTVPAETSKIFDKAFGNNKKIKKIMFAGNLITSFGAGLLEGNKTIEEIVLSAGVTVIGENMFKGCTGLRKFTITSSMTTIGKGAFDGCTGLEELVIEDRTAPLTFADGTAAMFVGKEMMPASGTFSGVKSLKKITFPSDTYVGYYVFAHCGVQEIEFMGNATIAPSAFMDTAISKATFHGTVTFTDFTYEVDDGRGKPYEETIGGGKGVFAGCPNLTEVDFGTSSGLTKIPESFFYFTESEPWAEYKTSALKTINIPETVTEFGNYSFEYTAIESFTFKSTVTAIGNSMFANCASLATVTFEEDSPITELKDSMFSGCSALSSITIPAGVNKIGSSCFYGCASLKQFTLPNGITTVGYRTFMNSGLTSVFIPAAVTSLGQNAFDGCKDLTSITFHANSVLSSINGTALRNTGLTEFTFPETGKDITFSANQGLFNGCTNMKRVVLSSGVKNIAQLFINCPTIETVVLAEEGPFMEENGFYYNKAGYPTAETAAKTVLYKALSTPEEFTIPSSVTSIGAYAFSGNTTLKKLTVPNSISSINQYTFESCKGVEEIIFVSEGNTMTAIPNYSMNNCSSLVKLVLPDSVATIGTYALRGCPNLSDITMNGVKSIGWGGLAGTGIVSIDLSNVTTLGYANGTDGSNFRDCVNLKTVTFGTSTIDTINGNIFSGCTSLESVTFNENQKTFKGGNTFANCTSLKTLDLSNVTTMASSMFTGCTALTSVTLNDSLTTIGSSMFQGCTSLSSFTFPAATTSVGSSAFKDCGLTEITFPEGVKTIGASAFENNTSLTTVNFPSTLTTISNNAFYNTALTKVTIPAKVTSIGQKAFANCPAMTQVKVDGANATYFDEDNGVYNSGTGKLMFVACGVEGTFTVRMGATISPYAFEGSKVEEVTIPEGINAIGENAFYGATGLKTVSIPVTVRTIDFYAFRNCTAMETFEMPDSVNKVNPYAFEGCTSLTTVKMSNSVTAIMNYTFKDCTALKSVTLPKNLKAINGSAFLNCSALETLVLPATLLELGTYPDIPKLDTNMYPLGHVFEGCTSLKTIVIPENINVVYQYTFAGWTSEQTVYFECAESAFGGQDDWNADCEATIVFGYKAAE